ncbi:MAG: hypothetical protein FJ399_22445 [Verrucomicrobia bacterium]|nr:hypothetical protein [Verrucomicrobiota bacterium]
MGRVFLLGVFLIAAAGLRGDRALEIALIHVEAIGGVKRIEALQSLRAHGHVVTSGKQVRFTMTAARPARIRLETDAGGRTLIQASDGEEPPWEFDTGTWPPQYREMSAGVARTFAADAEFDDPLVARASRGYTLDYAGELTVDGRKLVRVLVTRKFSETFSLLLDEETYFVVMRVEHRESAGGRKLQLVTHYSDFRPVDGVLLPHTVTLTVDGKATQQTKISRIEANPDLKNVVFVRPKPRPAQATP